MSFLSKFIKNYAGRLTYVSGGGTSSRPRSREIEDNEICTAIIDCNATHFARGEAVHIIRDPNGRIKSVKRDSPYSRLFRNPNPMMSRQDFLYAMAWQLQLSNTAYAWVRWDATMKPVEIWPLAYLSFEIKERIDGGYAIQFHDNNCVERVVPIEDLVVFRRKYDATGFAGRGNEEIRDVIEMSNTLDEGLKQALKISNKINGILRNTKSMLKSDRNPEEIKKMMQNVAENGGILELDAMQDYTPLDSKTHSATAGQMKEITNRIYNYWRTPLEVVNNTASEQTMQNYYDSIIEPIWEEASDAFSKALFTSRERGFGNEILITSGATTGASWQTKLNIVRDTKEQGLLTVNEQRELLGYGPVEDGDDRLVSLNYIKSTDQSKYQTGSDAAKEGGKNNGESGNTGQSNE